MEKKISKFLSLVLRHKPEVLDLKLDEYGWARVDELIEKMQNKEMQIDIDLLKRVVSNNDKQRFTFDADFEKIRANQGHSIQVNLEFKPIEPPTILFHGTAQKNISSIFEKGLLKGKRQYVHLSTEEATAIKVGQRYGQPVVLRIESKIMYEDGHEFYRSKNGVWQTNYIAPEYIQKLSPTLS